jgi:hypothetical protein
MRCSDVTRELAVPTGSIDPAALSLHLQDCPRCSTAAANAQRFERLWAETRPESPSNAAWDALWDRVDLELASSPAAESARLLPMRGWIKFGPIAAAAALLLGLGLASWFRSGENVGDQLVRTNPAVTERFLEVEIGQTVLYDVDRGVTTVVQTNEEAGPAEWWGGAFYGPDDFLAFLNLAECWPETLASNDLVPAAEVRP